MSKKKTSEGTSVTVSGGGKTVTIKGDVSKVLSAAVNSAIAQNKDDMLPAQRMEDAIGKLQSALSALALAQEQLSIVDSQMLGCDENRRRVVESSKENPLDTANDIESHRSQAGQIKEAADLVAKAGKAIGGKAGFIAQALASVYKDELIAGDRERDKQAAKIKDGVDPRQAPLFPDGDEE